MSIGVVKEDSQTLKRIGEFIRQGEMDKAYDLMAQAFGPASVEALKKAVSYGITPEKLGELLVKAPLAVDRFEQRLQQRGKDIAMAEKIEKQIAAQKAAEIAATKEAAESQKKFEERMKYYEEQKKKLHNKDKKLSKEEESLLKKMHKEKKAEKRRQIEQKLREVREKKRQLLEEKKKLEAMRQREEETYKRPDSQKSEVKQTTLNQQMINNGNSR
ncbi:MAG: hypothetical protein NC218_04265 [Acetobacter sp.]|nr:hypothetical protein [Acetobacter sp.]